MAIIKSEQDREILREGGRRLARILAQVAARVAPGVTTSELDDYAAQLIEAGGDKPAFRGYRPPGSYLAYPAALCTSINSEVVHGIPSNRKLVAGDIVGLDLGLEHGGLFTDHAITVAVGPVDSEVQALINATKAALAKAIAVVRRGATIGDIGAAIEKYIKPLGYGIVRDLCGHGVGYKVHDEPMIPNFGKAGTGRKLKEGEILAIEPMINLGKSAVNLEQDGFTFTTRDGSLSAHFEHTIIVTKNGAEIITAV
jgi:methionyl aminopeptidase